jgi:hypothetical protein
LTVGITQASHIIVADDAVHLKHQLLEKLNVPPSSLQPNVHIVRINWFQECLKQRQRLPETGFELLGDLVGSPQTQRTHQRRPTDSHHDALSRAQADLAKLQQHPNRPFGHWSTVSSSLYRSQPAPAITVDTLFSLYRADGMQLAITQYHCYNCGDTKHGARHCPQPLRGTHGNAYNPAECPYVADIPKKDALRTMPLRICDKFLCARKHPLDGEVNPNADIIDELERLVEVVYEPQADSGVRICCCCCCSRTASRVCKLWWSFIKAVCFNCAMEVG